MYQGGALLTTDNELVQACIKGLSTLFQSYTQSKSEAEDSAIALLHDTHEKRISASHGNKTTLSKRKNQHGASKTNKMPLKEPNLRLLIQLLTSSVMEVTSSYQNAAFKLIKALVESRIVLPEMYDLMEKLIDLIVLSHQRGVREAASTTVNLFLLHYPLGHARFQTHLKKLLINCSYEFEEGRENALVALSNLMRLLPLPLLEENAQIVFIPMALRAISDPSETCRERAAEVMRHIGHRVNVELYATFVEYALKWLSAVNQFAIEKDTTSGASMQALGLIKAGACSAAVLVASRPDIFKKPGKMAKLLTSVHACLSRLSTAKPPTAADKAEDHAPSLYSALTLLLSLLDKAYSALPSTIDEAIHSLGGSGGDQDGSTGYAMVIVGELLLYPHAKVQGAACRVLQLYLSRRNPKLLANPTGTKVSYDLLLSPNYLYDLGRKLCVVLNRPSLSEGHLYSAMYCIKFVVCALFHNPGLTVQVEQPSTLSLHDEEEIKAAGSEPGVEDDEDDADESEGEDEVKSPTVDDDVAPEEEGADEEQAGDGEEGDDEVDEGAAGKDGSNWIMQRLRGIGTDSRGLRRYHVLKVRTTLV